MMSCDIGDDSLYSESIRLYELVIETSIVSCNCLAPPIAAQTPRRTFEIERYRVISDDQQSPS